MIWDTPRTHKGWKHMNGHYHRSSKGGGEWEFFDLPQQWTIGYKGLTFNLKPFSFKHTGPVSYTHLDVYKRQPFLFLLTMSSESSYKFSDRTKGPVGSIVAGQVFLCRGTSARLSSKRPR